MLTLNMPIRQYAISSARVVFLLDAHDIFLATKKSRDVGEKSVIALALMPVASSMAFPALSLRDQRGFGPTPDRPISVLAV
jgi:hypothetical protein